MALEIEQMQMKTPLILSLLLGCTLGETASADWYKSTAEPNLVVRTSPDVSGKKLGNVPVDGKVNVLERVGNQESIGGNDGYWVKIEWKDKTAYAFDAFLTPVASHDSPSKDQPVAVTPSKRIAGKALSVDEVLNEVYEGYDDKNNCRRYHSDRPDYYYCMKVDRLDTCKDMVENGHGYAIMPSMILHKADSVYKTHLTDKNNQPIKRKTWMIYQKEVLTINAVKAFVEFSDTIDYRNL